MKCVTKQAGMRLYRHGRVIVTHLCLLATVAVRGNTNLKHYLTTLPIAKIT